MPSMITVTGHLGANAETRRAGEHDVASLRVACDTGWGEAKTTTWWTVDVWGKPSEWIGKLRKGAGVTVIGEAYLREWTGKDGKVGATATIRATSVITHERAEAGDRGGAGGGKRTSNRDDDGGWGGR